MLNPELKNKLEDICLEDTQIYNYSPEELKITQKQLREIINNNVKLSEEDAELVQNALRVVSDYIVIYYSIPFRMLDTYYLKLMNNNDLIATRNSVTRILNQHVLMYNSTLLPLCSRTIDVSVNCLMKIKNELEARNLNPYLTKYEVQDVMENMTLLGKSYVMS